MILSSKGLLTYITFVRSLVGVCSFVNHQIIRFSEVAKTKSKNTMITCQNFDKFIYLQMYSFFGRDFFLILSFVADSANLWKLNFGSSVFASKRFSVEDDCCEDWGISMDAAEVGGCSWFISDWGQRWWWWWWWLSVDQLGDNRPNCFRHSEATSIEFWAKPVW